MSDFAHINTESRCRAAHAWYCDLMKMRFDFRFVERQWFAAITDHDAKSIARAARYVKKQIDEGGWDRNAAVPTNFLQADKLADYVSVSTPTREFKLTDDERTLADEFKSLIGETVKKIAIASVVDAPPKNWRLILTENYPNAASYTDFFALPEYIQTEVRSESERRTTARPALPP
jgi:hypothetical protein